MRRPLRVTSKFIHGLPFLVTGELSRIAAGPSTRPIASEPEGSLDGWPRWQILADEGMAGCLCPSSFSPSPHRPPASIRTFFEACIAACQLGSAQNQNGCCHLTADLATATVFGAVAGPRATRSHPNSASLSKTRSQLHAATALRSLRTCKVRILPRLPTAGAAGRPVSVRPPPRPFSSRSYHRARPAPSPIGEGRCPAQTDPKCDARIGPA